MQSLTRKNLGLSYCRSIATIAIISLHTGFVLSTSFNFSMHDNIILRLFVNCSMWAVPTFLMVTGVLILEPSKNLTLKKLTRKYIARIFYAILIFVAIYQIVDTVIEHKTFEPNQIFLYFENLYRGRTYSTMWYLYMLIGLYLMMPMYRAFTKACNEKEIKFVLLVYLVFISIIPLIGSFKIKSGFYIHELTIYPLYMFLGYSFNKGLIKIDRIKGATLFIVSTIVLIFLTYFRWQNNYENFEVFWSYASFIVIIQSTGFFNLIMHSTNNLGWQRREPLMHENRKFNEKVNRFFSYLLLKVDACSFGIYLIHIILIRIFINMPLSKHIINSSSIFWLVLILTFINFLLSYIITKCLKKVPVFKSIL